MDARDVVLAPGSPEPAQARFSALRLGMGALSRVAPGLAARIAEELWFTPPRPRLREHARAFLATGARSDLTVNGRSVVAWCWGSGPTVVLMHGWGGNGAQMRAFVEPLVTTGRRVVIFDAPSHGQSGPSRYGPRRATLFEFAEALHVIAREHGPLGGIVAHSGGATAAAWAIKDFHDWSAPPMALIAPMASAIRYKRLFHDALGLTDAAMRRFTERTERRFGFRWEDFEVPGMAARFRTPPVLVVHDRDDAETSWTESASIAAAWPDTEEHYTSGLGHRRILRDPDVIARVVRFLTQPRTATDPSARNASTR